MPRSTTYSYVVTVATLHGAPDKDILGDAVADGLRGVLEPAESVVVSGLGAWETSEQESVRCDECDEVASGVLSSHSRACSLHPDNMVQP